MGFFDSIGKFFDKVIPKELHAIAPAALMVAAPFAAPVIGTWAAAGLFAAGAGISYSLGAHFRKEAEANQQTRRMPQFEMPEIGPFEMPDVAMEGSRLDDLRISSSAYGKHFPWVFGRVKVAGQIIWSEDELEEQKESRSEGNVNITEYKYYATLAVAFAKGTVKHIRRIWFDNKLVYDFRIDQANSLLENTWTETETGTSTVDVTTNADYLDPDNPRSQSAILLETDSSANKCSIKQTIDVPVDGKYNIYMRALQLDAQVTLDIDYGEKCDPEYRYWPKTFDRSLDGDGNPRWESTFRQLSFSAGQNTIEISHETTADARIVLDSILFAKPDIDGGDERARWLSFQLGEEDELPYDRIQDRHKWGSDYVPAYRDLAYIYIEHMPLEKFGNRIPQFYAEVEGEKSDLQTVVEALCAEAGLESSEYDASDLANIVVQGAFINNETSYSGWLEALRKVYGFDVVETQGKLYFKRHGGLSSVATFEEDEMSFRADGQAAGADVDIQIKAEQDLPRKLSLQYIDYDRDFEDGVQTAFKGQTDSANDVTIQLPVVLTADGARQLADIALWRMWTERQFARWTAGPSRLDIDAGDVVTLPVAGQNRLFRVTRQGMAGIGQVAFTGLSFDNSVFASSSRGDSGLFRSQSGYEFHISGNSESWPDDSTLVWLDIPLVDFDDDDSDGVYVAAIPAGTSWDGCEFLQSTDDSAFYDVGAVASGVTYGTASTTLADGTVYRWDRSNTVTVTLSNGSLETKTETEVLAGDNLAILGDEVFQFATATRTGPETWILSDLIRGKRGTDWATGSHGSSETFVLLERTKLLRVESTLTSTGYYKAVTIDQDDGLVSSTSKTNNGISLEPYSPVNITGSQDSGTNDWTINWVRRSRLDDGAYWTGTADVVLGEDSEAYEVDILDAPGGSVQRTITGLSSETATYTSAQQTTDFGSPQSTIYVDVYQVSADADITRGYGREATLS